MLIWQVDRLTPCVYIATGWYTVGLWPLVVRSKLGHAIATRCSLYGPETGCWGLACSLMLLICTISIGVLHHMLQWSITHFHFSMDTCALTAVTRLARNLRVSWLDEAIYVIYMKLMLWGCTRCWTTNSYQQCNAIGLHCLKTHLTDFEA